MSAGTRTGHGHNQIGTSRENACAYCHLHKARLSVKQMRNRQCLSKKCRHFIPWKQHPYWKQREIEAARKKANKKARKEAIHNAICPVQTSEAGV